MKNLKSQHTVPKTVNWHLCFKILKCGMWGQNQTSMWSEAEWKFMSAWTSTLTFSERVRGHTHGGSWRSRHSWIFMGIHRIHCKKEKKCIMYSDIVCILLFKKKQKLRVGNMIKGFVFCSWNLKKIKKIYILRKELDIS